jgi:hypothetical protein
MSDPVFLPRQGVRLAARVLPAGSRRDRYERELVAEMYAMSARRQRIYAFGVLTHALSLRAALSDIPHVNEEPVLLHKPLMCRLNIHHVWRWDSAEDGTRYEHCSSCGKDRSDYPEDGGPSLSGRGMPMPF